MVLTPNLTIRLRLIYLDKQYNERITVFKQIFFKI